MPGKCGCSGQTCGCSIVAGTGVTVTGTGTAADPFKVAVNPYSLNLGTAIQVSNSASIELTKTGSGNSGDPILLQGIVVVRSPDNSRWTPTISNAGTPSWVKL